MLREEANWLANVIYSLEPDRVFPMLNIGSSTQYFREKEQPWIDENLFFPARAMGYSVIHLDMKNDVGVDIVGDLCDPIFLEKLSQMNIKSVLCSNLLEHVLNREEICKNISSIIHSEGFSPGLPMQLSPPGNSPLISNDHRSGSCCDEYPP